MKKRGLVLILLLSTFGSTFYQSQGQEIIVKKNQRPVKEFKWAGTVRFKPAVTVLGLLLGGVEVVADWTPYVRPNLGIPVEFDIAYDIKDKVMIFGMMSGIEAVPFRFKEKNGLYVAAMAGFLCASNYDVMVIALTAKADIGYQLVSRGGFVFTPAVGVNFNGLVEKNSGFSFEIMLDIGFAYKKKAH